MQIIVKQVGVASVLALCWSFQTRVCGRVCSAWPGLGRSAQEVSCLGGMLFPQTSLSGHSLAVCWLVLTSTSSYIVASCCYLLCCHLPIHIEPVVCSLETVNGTSVAPFVRSSLMAAAAPSRELQWSIWMQCHLAPTSFTPSTYSSQQIVLTIAGTNSAMNKKVVSSNQLLVE